MTSDPITRTLSPSATAPGASEYAGRISGALLRHWPMTAVVTLLVAASVVPIWVTTYFPSQNGPQFLLNIHMLREFDNPAFNYDEFYTVDIRFIPHLLHSIFVYAFSFPFPILVAHKLALSLYAVLLPLSVFYFLRVVAPRNVLYALVGFLYIYNFAFMRGYHDYAMSIPFFFVLLGYWLQEHERLTAPKALLVVLLTFVVCLGHLFSFLLFGLVAGVWTVLGRDRLPNLVKLLACTAPCLLAAIAYMRYAQETSLTFFDAADTEFDPFHTSIENLFRKFLVTFSLLAGVVAALPVVMVLGLVGLRFYRCWSAWLKGHRRALRALASDPRFVVGAVLLLFYFAMPWKFQGWHKVDARVIPFLAIMMLACALPLPKGAARKAFVTLTVLSALTVYGITTGYVRELGAGVEARVAGVAAMERNAVVLPLVLENPKTGEVRPFTRMYDYYTLLNGGVTGQSIAKKNNDIVPVVYKRYPVSDYLPSLSSEEISEERIRELAAIYDYLVVFGQQAGAMEKLDASDLTLVFSNAVVRVYRFR